MFCNDQIDRLYLFDYLRRNLGFTLSRKPLKNQANSYGAVEVASGQGAIHVNDHYKI